MMGSMFDYLWIFHVLYYRCRMAHFCNILPTGCKLISFHSYSLFTPELPGELRAEGLKVDAGMYVVDIFNRYYIEAKIR